MLIADTLGILGKEFELDSPDTTLLPPAAGTTSRTAFITFALLSTTVQTPCTCPCVFCMWFMHSYQGGLHGNLRQVEAEVDVMMDICFV
jgi:hypothetical protein